MNCETIKTRLNAFLDGELPEREREEVSAHLQDCTNCRTVADDLRSLDERLQREFQPWRGQVAALEQRVLKELPQVIPAKVSSWTAPIWRSGLLAISAAAAGFLFAWFLLSRPQPVHQPAGAGEMARDASQKEPQIQLTVATGAVEVKQGGQWQAMPTGGLVGCGQSIRTPARGCCEFRTPDGSEVRLNNDTEVVFETNRKVRLEKGQLWSTVAQAKEQFQVVAALTTVTALGTQFDLIHRPDQMILTVLEGKTRVEKQGKTVEVPSGFQFLAAGTDLPAPSRRHDFELFQATNWVHEILVLKGRSNPELVRRIDDIFAGIGETKMGYLVEEEIRVLGDHTVIPLTRYLQSERSKGQPEKRHRAARLLADLAQPRSIGDMIPLLIDDDPVVRGHIASGLKRLTGQELGYSTNTWRAANVESCQKMQSSWQQWWQANQFRCTSDSK